MLVVIATGARRSGFARDGAGALEAAAGSPVESAARSGAWRLGADGSASLFTVPTGLDLAVDRLDAIVVRAIVAYGLPLAGIVAFDGAGAA